VTNASTSISANELHKRLGHVNEEYMRRSASMMNLTVTGTMTKCEACAIGKSKQKTVPKRSDIMVTSPGEMMHIDIASIKHPSKGGKKFWILFVDGFS
jgi:tRNA U34 2-thiouridine synthase MnmA/TrmU